MRSVLRLRGRDGEWLALGRSHLHLQYGLYRMHAAMCAIVKNANKASCNVSNASCTVLDVPGRRMYTTVGSRASDHPSFMATKGGGEVVAKNGQTLVRERKVTTSEFYSFFNYIKKLSQRRDYRPSSSDHKAFQESVSRMKRWINQNPQANTFNIVELIRTMALCEHMPAAYKSLLLQLVMDSFSEFAQATLESNSRLPKENIVFFFKAIRSVGCTWEAMSNKERELCFKLISKGSECLGRYDLDVLLIELKKFGCLWIDLQRDVRSLLLHGILRVIRESESSKVFVLSYMIKLYALRFSVDGLPSEEIKETSRVFEALMMEQFNVMSADKSLDTIHLYLSMVLNPRKNTSKVSDHSTSEARLRSLATAFQTRMEAVVYVDDRGDEAYWSSKKEDKKNSFHLLRLKNITTVLYVLSKLNLKWDELSASMRQSIINGIDPHRIFPDYNLKFDLEFETDNKKGLRPSSIALILKSLGDIGFRLQDCPDYYLYSFVAFVNQMLGSLNSKLDMSVLIIGLAKLGFKYSDFNPVFTKGIFKLFADDRDGGREMDIFTLIWAIGQLGLQFPLWPQQAKEATRRYLRLTPLQYSARQSTAGGYTLLKTSIKAFQAAGMTARDLPIEFWITYIKYLSIKFPLIGSDYVFSLLETLNAFGVQPSRLDSIADGLSNASVSASNASVIKSNNYVPNLLIVLKESEINDYTPIYSSSNPDTLLMPLKVSQKLEKYFAGVLYDSSTAKRGDFMQILAKSEDRQSKVWLFSSALFRSLMSNNLNSSVHKYLKELEILRSIRIGHEGVVSSVRREVGDNFEVVSEISKDGRGGEQFSRFNEEDVGATMSCHLSSRQWPNLDDIIAALELYAEFRIVAKESQTHKKERLLYQSTGHTRTAFYVRSIVAYLDTLSESQIRGLTLQQKYSLNHFLELVSEDFEFVRFGTFTLETLQLMQEYCTDGVDDVVADTFKNKEAENWNESDEKETEKNVLGIVKKIQRDLSLG